MLFRSDIERRKMRADFGITYDVDVMRQIDDLRSWGIDVTAVVITRFEDQPAVNIFKNKLERRNIKVYTHRYTKGYPTDVDMIVSDAGYGANDYIETTNPLVIVTGPGPGSGKLATCLSQMYHEHKQGRSSGYAKFETFPIWSIPLKHPVNVAYEAATADLGDFNLIDPYHLEEYNQPSINYNRDVEVFPVLKRILEKIMGHAVYNSPTDMGVNMAGFGIVDDDLVSEAAKQEIIRRFFRYRCEYALGYADMKTVQRAELIMRELDLKPEDRRIVEPARRSIENGEMEGKGNEGIYCGAAIELHDGTIVTGKNSPLMHAASSLILNAIKTLAGIPDEIHLLAPGIIESIGCLKKDILNSKTISLDLEETLIALSVSTTTNPTSQMAMAKLKQLENCEVHLTHIPTPGDEAGLRKLGVNLTSDPNFPSRALYVT